MEKFFEGEEPDPESLQGLIRKGTLNMSFVPVLCGSAFKNKGVQPMLNAVIDFFPVRLTCLPTKALSQVMKLKPVILSVMPMMASRSPALPSRS